MNYEIFKSIPHQRVIKNIAQREEIFDLYQCGIFNQENIELVELQAQTKYQPHFHAMSCATIYIISGAGIFHLAQERITYQPGLRIDIPAGILHGFETHITTLFLSIQTPPIINPTNGEIDLCYE